MRFFCFLILLSVFTGCKTADTTSSSTAATHEIFVLTFGSCNKVDLPNELWDDILATHPDVWVWGGDIVYADTDDAAVMKSQYDRLLGTTAYARLQQKVPVMATWDDHDYGLNDGGANFDFRDTSQQLFLDFLGVPENSPRRNRQGVYHARNFKIGSHTVKVIVLDTRYFRSELRPSEDGVRRYDPHTYGEGTLLGEAQWEWLRSELTDSEADFHIVMSSIQFLSGEHGFESWANFPHEKDRFYKLLAVTQPRRLLLLSGDRHISEFSRSETMDLDYPLIDFTSSGLTHVYEDFNGEPNSYRIGEVINKKSFGQVVIDLERNFVTLRMIGDQGKIFGELHQQY